MDDRTLALLERVVRRVTGERDPEVVEDLTRQCFEYVERRRVDPRLATPGPDLADASDAISRQLGDSQRALVFANLVSRLQAAGDESNGPANLGQMLEFLRLVAGSDPRPEPNQATSRTTASSRTTTRAHAHTVLSRKDDLADQDEDQYQPDLPPELNLVPELPYVLQGIKTDNFSFVVSDTGQVALTVSEGVRSWPLLGLLNELLEPALLYKTLEGRVEDMIRAAHSSKPALASKSAGLVQQALYSSIQQDLHNYVRIVGAIEEHVKTDAELTLKRSLVLLQDAILGLRLLYAITEETQDLIGGQVLDVLQRYSYNGDEFVERFAAKLLDQVSRPFYEMLDRWVASGTLMDPHNEFFVVESADASTGWDRRFTLDSSRVPSFFTEKQAHSVFEIGKTLFFIRVACKDSHWVDVRKSSHTPITSQAMLSSMLTDDYNMVVQHLNTTLRHKFSLDRHLQGLKDYLLLGNGDFVQTLLDMAAETLDRPATKLLRHHLTSVLEGAIANSSSRHDHPAVLQCLDARMLELGHGDIGWDVFTLDYRVESPLDVVLLSKKCLTDYLRVFNFLWRIRHMSFELNATWLRMAKVHPSGSMTPELAAAWLDARAVFLQMKQFLSELQYYINYEVVEIAWAQFQQQLSKQSTQSDGPLTVDEIIAAHKAYLDKIVYKGLLGGSGELIAELHGMLKDILAFCQSVQALDDVSLRLQSALLSPSTVLDSRLQNIHTRIANELQPKFAASVEALVAQLQSHDDSEMRFLSVRLDFNRFYSR